MKLAVVSKCHGCPYVSDCQPIRRRGVLAEDSLNGYVCELLDGPEEDREAAWDGILPNCPLPDFEYDNEFLLDIAEKRRMF
jgi:hypothetical protein